MQCTTLQAIVICACASSTSTSLESPISLYMEPVDKEPGSFLSPLAKYLQCVCLNNLVNTHKSGHSFVIVTGSLDPPSSGLLLQCARVKHLSE